MVMVNLEKIADVHTNTHMHTDIYNQTVIRTNKLSQKHGSAEIFRCTLNVYSMYFALKVVYILHIQSLL